MVHVFAQERASMWYLTYFQVQFLVLVTFGFLLVDELWSYTSLAINTAQHSASIIANNQDRYTTTIKAPIVPIALSVFRKLCITTPFRGGN